MSDGLCHSYNHLAPADEPWRCYDSPYALHHCASARSLPSAKPSAAARRQPAELWASLVLVAVTASTPSRLRNGFLSDAAGWLSNLGRATELVLAPDACGDAADSTWCAQLLNETVAAMQRIVTPPVRVFTPPPAVRRGKLVLSRDRYQLMPHKLNAIYAFLNRTYPVGGPRDTFLLVEDDTFVRLELFARFWAGLPHGTPFAFGSVISPDDSELFEPEAGSLMRAPCPSSSPRGSSLLRRPGQWGEGEGCHALREAWSNPYLPYSRRPKLDDGCCCRYRHFPSGCYPAGGAGFGFNRLGLALITSSPPGGFTAHLTSKFGDVAAGKLFRKAGLPLIHCGSFLQLTPRFLQGAPTNFSRAAAWAAYGRAISFHHADSAARANLFRTFYPASQSQT